MFLYKALETGFVSSEFSTKNTDKKNGIIIWDHGNPEKNWVLLKGQN
jgi:hypothetical protein